MARYKVTGTASVHLVAEFDDDGSDLYDQAAVALRAEYTPAIAIFGMDIEVDDVEEIDTPPTLGETIKSKVSLARAWVMGE